MDLFTYPTTPGFKEGDTSRAAAESMESAAPLLRMKVLDQLRAAPQGLTPDECAARLGLTVLSVRPRFSELKLQGKIEPTGERRANVSSRAAKVFRHT